MDKQALIQNLVKHFAAPQSSERWAMYHLISPVVDFANLTSGLISYYEFQQPSAHKTFQKVDIALLDSVTRSPRVMVEAKQFRKPVSAELIRKYLKPGVRGAVTNGFHWVLCVDDNSKIVTLSSVDGTFFEEALNEVVSFISSGEVDTSVWNDGDAYTAKCPAARASNKQAAVAPHSSVLEASIAKSKKSKSTVDATGPSAAAQTPNPVPPRGAKATIKPAASVSEEDVVKPKKRLSTVDVMGLAEAVRTLQSVSPLEATLLSDLATNLSVARPFAQHLRFEVSETRIVLFDERVASRNERRVARIKLGATRPDVIVRTSIVSSDGCLSSILPHFALERGPHMRRFRLGDAKQTVAFAKELARVLSAKMHLSGRNELYSNRPDIHR
ncbi:hypothetical protein [Caballeronia sp. LZ035]|uniref:hypothetical protein n=1 Tax=Caballeronia sp. LZ035 TaxID=3038568 RepID=UPI00286614B2|nr:hypothetical protein [Caballeronia sp. LZ035]MDR5763263.1 hypothetical protein [Caballeronia sp. LZ035]